MATMAKPLRSADVREVALSFARSRRKRRQKSAEWRETDALFILILAIFTVHAISSSLSVDIVLIAIVLPVFLNDSIAMKKGNITNKSHGSISPGPPNPMFRQKKGGKI